MRCVFKQYVYDCTHTNEKLSYYTRIIPARNSHLITQPLFITTFPVPKLILPSKARKVGFICTSPGNNPPPVLSLYIY